MKKIRVESDHAMIFIYDTENEKMKAPCYQKSVPVNYNSSCVSVITQFYLDGDTFISLGNKLIGPTGKLVYSGEIDAPSKKISINTTEKEQLLSQKVSSTIAKIKIWMDDDKFPEHIQITVS